MKPFQERVVQEQILLDDNIDKLSRFLDNKEVMIDIEERDRLATQLLLMQAYSNILGMRINHFGD